MNLKDHISSVPDFPKPGILFYDISPLLANPEAWQVALDRMASVVTKLQPDVLAGIDARGFLVTAPIAARLNLGFTMIRKQGKLPGKTISYEYDLEYGKDTIEILSDAFQPSQRVVVLDDLLATGGTLGASIELVKKIGGNPVGAACLIELTFLNGRDKLGELPFKSLISYDE
jgi:adenine phosphoribosyltransferase